MKVRIVDYGRLLTESDQHHITSNSICLVDQSEIRVRSDYYYDGR